MKFVRSSVLSSCALLALAGVAGAGTYSATIAGQNIFGGLYNIDIFRVADDLLPIGPRLEPEGMVFYNGTLYVSGDAATPGPAETNGYLAAYAGGLIGSTPSAVGQFVFDGRVLGPEGITVNTRGSGYGSFGGAPRFIAVDNAGGTPGRVLAVLDPSGPSVGEVQTGFLNTDDVAYVPGATAAQDRLAIIDGAAPTTLRWYSTDATPVALPGSFPIPAQSKGLLFLPAADAALFSPWATADCLLIAVSPEFAGDTNKLQLYTLDGTLLASSDLPTGLPTIGAGVFGNIEALAWDPDTRRLFIGDETGANSQIAVLTVPAPGAAGILALGAALIGRRRR